MAEKTKNKNLSKANKKTILNKKDADTAAKALEVLFTTNYISRRHLYFQNFLRGVFFSAGTIIGAAVIVAVSVWLLSFFNQIPVIGPAFDDLKQSIENSSSSN